MIKITFLRPEFLWFFLVIPIMIILHFYFLRKSKAKALSFANFRVLKRISGHNQITKNKTILIIRAVAFIMLILGVAGLTINYEGPSNNNSFVIAIDTSASMTAQDLPPSRLDFAKNVALEFVDSIEGDASVGLLTFSGISIVKSLPTSDKNEIKSAIKNVKIDESGGTDIPTAIITGTNMLLSLDTGKNIIIITDGSNTVETFVDDSLKRSVDYALDKGVKIHTIGLGDNSAPIGYLPEYYGIPGTYNEKNLKKIANSTSGQFYKADKDFDLKQAYQEILNDVGERRIKKEIGKDFLLWGLILLMIEWFLINTRFRKLP